ncbi:MAG TPA: efflux RND transporter periplasmic adaptor subunit [Patescibacteria group bacterium]|nr:efflux RND transporter periplasmic adaptor subunit [Patescibacteria group bacterium]
MQTVINLLQRRKKWLYFLLIVTLVAAGGVIYMKKNATPAAKETTVAVSRGDIRSSVSATGSISAVNSVKVNSRVTGLLMEVRVKENDPVKAGQVLMVLDDSTARAQVAQYEAQMQNYAIIYERSKRLSAANAQALQQLDTDRTNYLASKANYDNFVAQMDYYVIRAPIDGIVIGDPTPAGETVVQGLSAAQTLMTIADMSKMQVKVMVDETDIGKVKTGQTATFTVDAYADKTFSGKVRKISKDATTSSNVVYYYVYVDVDESGGLLYPTMTARVTLNVGEGKNVLLVPSAAVKEEKGKKYVQVMVGGQSQNIPVTTGLTDDENIEITSGLSEGDQVVLPAAVTSTTQTTSNKNQGPPPPM